MTGSNNLVSHEDNIDIRRFLIKIITNWPIFVLSLGIAYSIAYLINRYTEPQYSVNTTVLVNEEKKTTAELLVAIYDKFGPRKNIDNEISILKSYGLARKSLSELDFSISYYVIGRVRESQIYKSNVFNVELDSIRPTKKYYPVYITVLDEDHYIIEIDKDFKIKKTLRFGEPFNHPQFNFTIWLNKSKYKSIADDPGGYKYFFMVNDINTQTNQYRNKLTISTLEKRGTVLSLSTNGPVAEQEVDYLNKLSEVYIRNGLDEKNKAAINTIRFIDIQLAEISDSLRKAEVRLQNFQLENKIIDLDEESSAVVDKIQNLLTSKATAEMQLKYYKYLKDYLDNKTDYNDIIAPSIMGITEPILNSLIVELAEIYKQKAVLNYSAQEDNPSMNMINLKIQKTATTLKENVNEMINSAQLSLKDINGRIDNADADLQKLPVTERQLINIKRDYDLNNTILNFLLQKRAEAGIVKASNIADNKVLDEARVDNAVQISPKRSRNYMTAIFLGGIIPLIIIFLIEFFNTRIIDLKELDRLKNCNVIGSIGHNTKSTDLPVFENPKSALAESFRSLRTNLQYLLRDKNENVILITSTISGEGKTFCSMNLAAILAMSNKKVLLIGLDLRKPKIHKLFNLSNEIGLSTYLIKRNTKEEIVFPTNIQNLYVIASGPVPPNPAELLETELMETLILKLKKEFDYIILDSPPVAIVTDALLLSKYSNTNIFVIRQNFSSKDVINLADEIAVKANMKQLNILVNDVRIPGYYGYSYKYGYGYSYRYGYGYYNYEHEYYGETDKPKTWKERLKNWLGG